MTPTASNGTGRLRLSEPPPDVVPDVTVAAPQALEGGLRLSEPPPDVVPDVTVAAPQALQLGVPPAHGKEPDYDDAPVAGELPDDAARPASGPLDNAAIYRVIREVAVPHSGAELYAAVAVDPGRLGLCHGLVLFPQASPLLGAALRLGCERDPRGFEAVFGRDAAELLQVTGAQDPPLRLLPVGGVALWDASWVERFRAAGAVEAFQTAQNEVAIEQQFRPMLAPALALGLASERALALLYDGVVSRGLGRALHWAVAACTPLRTAAARQEGLRRLGYADVAAFQAATPGLPVDGVAAAATVAALAGALRARDGMGMPGPADQAARLVAAARGEARERLIRLLDSPTLSDDVLPAA